MTSLRASDLAGQRIKEIRQRRGWTAKQLAERCAEIGAPEITISVIANIETGRRDEDGRRRREVTMDEVTTFAYALQVPPMLLMIPLDNADRLQVVDGVEMEPVTAALWVTGTASLQPEGRAQYEEARPLLLVQELATMLRVASRVKRQYEERGNREGARARLAEIGRDFAHRSEWLASLGITPPEVPADLADMMQVGVDSAHTILDTGGV